MSKNKTPSFVVELKLNTSLEDERLLLDRMLCATRLYNSVLNEGLLRVKSIRKSAEWKLAANMPKKTSEQQQARKDFYIAIRENAGFTKAIFDKLAAKLAKAAGFTTNKRIGSHEIQAIGERAFNALDDYLLKIHGKPRFKGFKRPLHSIQGKDNKGMLQWKSDLNVLQIERGWIIKPDLSRLKEDEWLCDALQSRTKYCRIKWSMIEGKRVWFLQLIQEGQTPLKAEHVKKLAKPGTHGGLDLGPSEIAWTNGIESDKVGLCDEVVRNHDEIKNQQRQIDRQRRVNNPQNYNANGTCKKGCKKWYTSNQQRANEIKLKELFRIEVAMRKAAHGKLVNTLLTKALIWKDDGVSPKWLQALFGKSVSVRAPGMLMDHLERKAERAGGHRMVIDVRRLKNSQYDHCTNTFAKKPLSQRWHTLGDGSGLVQRDIYSAFLALYSGESTYQSTELAKAWSGLESSLLQAGWYRPSASRRQWLIDNVGTSGDVLPFGISTEELHFPSESLLVMSNEQKAIL
jgi:putative transposase